MIEINLEGDWYLTSDKRNYVLSKKIGEKDNGDNKYNHDSFHSSIKSALKGYKDMRLKTSDAKTGQDLIDTAEKVDGALKRFVNKLEG